MRRLNPGAGPEARPRRAWLRPLAWGAGLLAVLAAGMVALSWTALPERALGWMLMAQHDLHQQLAAAVRAVQRSGAGAGWALAGLALLYGVFHAAGPGHGKAVIATYLGATRAGMRRGAWLALLAALVQGLTAIVAVEVALALLGLSLRRAQVAVGQVENLSFLLVALLGAVMAWRGGGRLARRMSRTEPAQPAQPALLAGDGGRMRPYCTACGHAHGPQRHHIEQAWSWRTVLVVLGVGLRPCTGAVLVLLAAHALGLRWAGVLAVLAMSLGTGATVALIAWGTVALRRGLFLAIRPAGAARLELLFEALSLLGGLLLLSMGAALAWQGWLAPSHPLL